MPLRTKAAGCDVMRRSWKTNDEIEIRGRDKDRSLELGLTIPVLS
jgi:hypothetical protein